jgi:hypothetical protein
MVWAIIFAIFLPKIEFDLAIGAAVLIVAGIIIIYKSD